MSTITQKIGSELTLQLIKSELSKNGFKFNSTKMEGVNKEFGESIKFTFNPKGKVTYMVWTNGFEHCSGKVNDITGALKEVLEISNDFRKLLK